MIYGKTTFDDYQTFTRTTAVYPGAERGTVEALGYLGLGLAGEAGEVANKVKKLIRDGDNGALRYEIRSELGDVLWYLARLADELDTTLQAIASANSLKLQGRKERGVLHGSGDNR